MQDLGRELERLPYRPGWGTILGSGGFFAVCGLVIAHKARTEGPPWLWLLVAASGAFVAAGIALSVLRLTRAPWLIVAERGLIVPCGRWFKEQRAIALRDVIALDQQEVHGQVLLRVTYTGGTFTLIRSHLPHRDDYRAILAFLNSGTWEREVNGSGGRGALGASRTAASDVAWAPPSWFRVAVKIFALLTFCGGPLYFSDLFEAQVAQPYAFVIAFSPVAVLVFVTLTVVEERLTRPSPFLIWAGWVALGLLLFGSAVAAFEILTGEPRKDSGLILFGCAVSVVTAVIYQRLTRSR